MAYTRYVYNRVNWINKSEGLTTPLGKTNLNRMDSAIYNIAENLNIAYDEFNVGKFDKADADKVIVGMPTWDSNTGILKFKFYDGTEFSVDFNIEKIPVSFSMDSAGVITMTTADGTEWTADIGDVIPTYDYVDSDTIAFSDTKDGDHGHLVSAQIKKNSITGEYLQPDYLADVTTQASNAAASAQAASDSADNAAYDAKLAQSYAIGGSGIRDGEDLDNAKASKEGAKKAAADAEGYADTADAKAKDAADAADAAKESEENSKESETNAKISETNSATSATNAANSATTASQKADAASGSADVAKESEESAADYANKAQSYAVGTGGEVREGDDADCAKAYYEQTKNISQGLNGLIPMGTITFEELSDEDNQKAGYFFNVSDSFVSDERFKDGSGIFYGAGNNVLYTADGMWDVTASSMVSGVKGSAETEYRQGFVNITKENVGLGNVGNFKAVSTVASQGLSDIEKSNARANIGAGTSSFSGNYDDLSGKPTIPTIPSSLPANGGNADTVDNLHASQTAGAKNSLVATNSNGYIMANYINSNTANNENSNISQIITTNGSDNYYRKSSLAQLKSALGIGAGAGVEATALLPVSGSRATDISRSFALRIGKYVVVFVYVEGNFIANASNSVAQMPTGWYPPKYVSAYGQAGVSTALGIYNTNGVIGTSSSTTYTSFSGIIWYTQA